MGLSGDELGIVLLSLKVALTSVVFSLPPAILVAYVLARGRFPGKILLDAVVHLPLVLPPVVVGFALLTLFGKRGAIGAWLDAWFGIVFAFRWTGAALAAAIMGFPLMVRAIRLSFEAVDRKLEAAASTLGAGRLAVCATVTFVSNIPGETRTLPLAIYTYTQVPAGDEAALRLSLIAVVLSLAALFVSEVLVRRAAKRVRGDDADGRH